MPDEQEKPKSRALFVDTDESGHFVGVGVYEVTDHTEDGGYVARLLEGIRIEPQHAYEIARRFTVKAMEAEANRSRDGV
jgi:hypothetical protein